MRFFHLLTITFILFQSGFVFAKNFCVNDPDGEKRAFDNSLNQIIARGDDPLTQAFKSSSMSFHFTTGLGQTCTIKNTVTEVTLAQAIDRIVEEQQNTRPKVTRDCIDASLERAAGGNAFSCESGSSRPQAIKGTPCINPDSAAYIQFSVNRALDCMSYGSGQPPLDPRFVLKKYNLETGFNFYTGYTGGVGMGQLISDPIQEIAGRHDEKTKGHPWIEGQAQYILENLMKNTNPACAPFQKILKKDLDDALAKKDPQLPKDNYCRFISPGEGLARNLIYSMGYYSFLRDNKIKPLLEDKAPDLANDPQVLNNLTLVAYGPGGMVAAKAMINRLRLSKKDIAKKANRDPEKVAKQIAGYSPYVNQTNVKMKELLDNLHPGGKNTIADYRGDVCIEREKGKAKHYQPPAPPSKPTDENEEFWRNLPPVTF